MTMMGETSRPVRVLSGAARRARQMMVGGLVLAHAVGLCVLGLALALGGAHGLAGAALGFAIVVIFFSIGQAIEIVACELEPIRGMGLALVSYAVRVIGIGAGMWLLMGLPAVEQSLDRPWLMAGVSSTTFAWIAGVLLVASRQRVPIYDKEYVAPGKRRNDGGDDPARIIR